MNVSDTRLANFLMLFKQFRDANATLPDHGMLKLFGHYLDLSDRYLSHVKNGRKPIGHATARQIEKATGKPEGWLDQRHDDLEPKSLAERVFIETALALYRAKPADAQTIMIGTLKNHLSGKQ